MEEQQELFKAMEKEKQERSVMLRLMEIKSCVASIESMVENMARHFRTEIAALEKYLDRRQ